MFKFLIDKIDFNPNAFSFTSFDLRESELLATKGLIDDLKVM
jgi:hypothetical protein